MIFTIKKHWKCFLQSSNFFNVYKVFYIIHTYLKKLWVIYIYIYIYIYILYIYIYIIININRPINECLHSNYINFMMLNNLNNGIRPCHRKMKPCYWRKQFIPRTGLAYTATTNSMKLAYCLGNRRCFHYLNSIDKKIEMVSTGCLQHILEAAPHKTAAVRPLMSNLTNHLIKTCARC